MLFPVVFCSFGIIIMCLSLKGTVVLTDDAVKINYGLSYVNKKIALDSIIEAGYVKGYESIPAGDPAKGDKRTVLKIKYNDADYSESQEIFISVEQHKELLTLIEQRIR